jgi:hypothetical protein
MPTDALAPESWRERITSVARFAVDRAGTFGRAAVEALVLDDWKALTDVPSTPLQRLEAAADLASWAIPEGKIAEIAGHALAKVAAEQAVAHVATAEQTAAAAAVGKLWAARSGNAKIAEQHAMNPSKIWDRPLTVTERHGRFEDHHDLAALLGPATERGGVKRNWHHIVESKSGFGSERVHNIDNVVAIEQKPIHVDISKTFQANDYRLGPGPDGKPQSLRTFLKGKPWDRHVAEGELELRKHGLDPDTLRVQTQQRFETRVQLHDRLHGVSRGKEAPMIAVPGGQRPVTNAAPDGPVKHGMPARTPGASPIEHHASAFHVVRDGRTIAVSPGYTQHGRLLSSDGERIVQDVGRGTAVYSRKELQAHFGDSKALDAMLKPGNYVHVGVGRNGAIDLQQQVPGRGWESLGDQRLPHLPQSPSAAQTR